MNKRDTHFAELVSRISNDIAYEETDVYQLMQITIDSWCPEEIYDSEVFDERFYFVLNRMTFEKDLRVLITPAEWQLRLPQERT